MINFLKGAYRKLTGATAVPVRVAIAVGLAVLLWTGCSAKRPDSPEAIVARIVSGQTIEVISDGSAQASRVRLAGLSAPDLDQVPWGPAAKRALTDWLLQQPVVLEVVGDADVYGRQLAYVWLDDLLINEALIAQGHAMAEKRFSSKYAQQLTHAQHQARLLGLGIWNPVNPMRQTPVEFRQQSSSVP